MTDGVLMPNSFHPRNKQNHEACKPLLKPSPQIVYGGKKAHLIISGIAASVRNCEHRINYFVSLLNPTIRSSIHPKGEYRYLTLIPELMCTNNVVSFGCQIT